MYDTPPILQRLQPWIFACMYCTYILYSTISDYKILLSLFVDFFRSYLSYLHSHFGYLFAAMASMSTPAAATKRQTIALVGFGNLAKFICEEISADERFELVVISRQVCSFTEVFIFYFLFFIDFFIFFLSKKTTHRIKSAHIQRRTKREKCLYRCYGQKH